ncbi:hypothetical protein [Actinoplanes sp. NPDC051851]|uniref:hypothetical protein n=1 Tax=Actinoplanes sp. NPDC051851 TaxID=3154753 RepID=UPI00343B76C8
MSMHAAGAVGALSAVAAALTAAYRWGRAEAAWRDVRSAKRSVRTSRRQAWSHTARLATGALLVLLGLTAAAFDLTH